MASDPFFSRGQGSKGGKEDPHVTIVTKTFFEGHTKVFEHWKNPANS